MIRNLKSLGIAFVAVLAMSAVVASAAQAVPSYTGSAYPTTGTGSNLKGSEKFTTAGGTVECNSHFEGTLASPGGPTLTVTPSYSSCEAFGFLSADVHENGCTYVFHASSRIAEGHYSSTVDVSCPGSNKMVITAATCEVQVGSQTGLSSVTTKNEGTGVKVVPNVSEITMDVTKDGFGCPFSGTGHSKGTYHGEVTLARVGGGSISVSGS